MEEIKKEEQLKNSNSVPNICDFSQNLDYDLQTAEERVEYINKMMYTEEGYPVEFFEKLFDQDERLEVMKRKYAEGEKVQKYLNLFPSSKEDRYEETYEAKQMEKITNYILQAPDQPRMDKQQEYNFYNEEEFERVLNKEDLYEAIAFDMRRSNSNSESYNDSDSLNTEAYMHTIGRVDYESTKRHFSAPRIKKARYIGKNSKMAFLKRVENYKFDNKITITQKDLKDPDLLPFMKDWETDIQSLKVWLKENPKSKNTRTVSEMIKSLRDAQIQYKASKKGIIVFKQPLKDDGRVDYEEFDFFDKQHVLALLNMPKRQVCDEDLPLLIYDLEVLMRNIKIRECDINVVEMYQNGFTQQDIADKLGVSQQNVNQVLSKLADNVIQEYEGVYEDWYYLNKVKGSYKKCSKCGEVKLENRFKRDASKIDGFRYNCKKCDKV